MKYSFEEQKVETTSTKGPFEIGFHYVRTLTKRVCHSESNEKLVSTKTRNS